MKTGGVVVAILVASQAVFGGAQAPVTAELKSMTVVPLTNGQNRVDVDGDGQADIVFVARLENFNAHGFDHITIYRAPSGDSGWTLVPLFDKRDTSSAPSFQTHEGADCILRDLRILKPATGSAAAVIVVAERQVGKSYAAREPITFTVYRAMRNPDSVPGSPSFSFRAAETIRSRTSHCDVEEAFKSELGLEGR